MPTITQQQRACPVNIEEIFLIEHLRWLLFNYNNGVFEISDFQNTLKMLLKKPLERCFGIYGPGNQSERCIGYCHHE